MVTLVPEQYQSWSIELSNTVVVEAGSGKQAIGFSWTARKDGSASSDGPLVFLAPDGSTNASVWQQIPYESAKPDPYGQHPDLSQDENNLLLAEHAALMCTMGG